MSQFTAFDLSAQKDHPSAQVVRSPERSSQLLERLGHLPLQLWFGLWISKMILFFPWFQVSMLKLLVPMTTDFKGVVLITKADQTINRLGFN